MSAPVMVIDDDDDLRETLASALETEGNEVVAFGDARDALAELRRGLRPTVVLLDLMMPGMSGWEFYASLRADPLLAAIPVVVITAARSLDGDGPPLGDIEVLRKPFTLAAVSALVRRHAAG